MLILFFFLLTGCNVIQLTLFVLDRPPVGFFVITQKKINKELLV